MSYITTVTGKHFDPMDPENQEIDIVDIAHALSLICRGNGHIKFFYSVAQHSIACAGEAIARGYSQEVILGCLLHDSSEAYISDVTRPVKKELPQYLHAEEELQNAIWRHFIGRKLTGDELKQIFEIDDIMLSAEFHQLMPEELNDDYRRLQSEFTCEYQNPVDVREQFIRMQRILKYERCMREAQRLLCAKENADRLQSLISELEAYYSCDDWKRDFEADEAGLLPKGLKRGVLSEDGIYDLLEEYKELSKQHDI